MTDKRPGPETWRSLGHTDPLPSNNDQIYPVDFENMKRPAWRVLYRFLIPLEDDQEQFKPSRLAAEFLMHYQRYGTGGYESPDVPYATTNCRYDNGDDIKKYASERNGYTECYNAYGWLDYAECQPVLPPLSHAKNLDTFWHAYRMANELLEGLPDFAYRIDLASKSEGSQLSFSFIGQRGTPWDWADSLVWDEDHSQTERSKLHPAFQPLYDKVDLIHQRIPSQEIPGSQLVHLNISQYMQTDDQGQQSAYNVAGWFDPSTFFWRPLEYAKAVFVFDFLLNNVQMSKENKDKVADLTIKDPLVAHMFLRAIRYRLLGTSRSMEQDQVQNKDESFLLRSQSFENAFMFLQPVLERYCTSRI